MVNLIKHRKEAVYPEEYKHFGSDIKEADMRYSKFILPKLLARGSYPIFYSYFFKSLLFENDWDFIGIIRYRCLKDFLDMALEVTESEMGSILKSAPIQDTQVLPVRLSFFIAPLPILVTYVCIFLVIYI